MILSILILSGKILPKNSFIGSVTPKTLVTPTYKKSLPLEPQKNYNIKVFLALRHAMRNWVKTVFSLDW